MGCTATDPSSGQQGHPGDYSKLFRRVFPAVLRLAVDLEETTRTLFSKLSMQLVRWFSQVGCCLSLPFPPPLPLPPPLSIFLAFSLSRSCSCSLTSCFPARAFRVASYAGLVFAGRVRYCFSLRAFLSEISSSCGDFSGWPCCLSIFPSSPAQPVRPFSQETLFRSLIDRFSQFF